MKVVLIGVAGGSGSGKTWLAHELERRLWPHAAILSLDDFYADVSYLSMAERSALNFDAPGAIDWSLLQRSLEGIVRGEAVWLPKYDFATHTRQSRRRRWRPRPVVLVEGLWPWRRPQLRRMYTLKVFRTGTEEIRLARRLARDVAQRERSEASVQQQWRRQVQPMYARYVRPQLRSADITVPAEAPEWRLARLTRKIATVAGLALDKSDAASFTPPSQRG